MRLPLTILFSFLVFYANSQNEIKITAKMPHQIVKGSSFTVELEIEKSTLRTYAIFKQELPKGFTVTENISEEAEFFFENQTLKLVWLRLPENKKIIIKYDVQTDSVEPGNYLFTGNLSYLKNNMRGNVNFSPLTLTVKSKDSKVTNVNDKTEDNKNKVADNANKGEVSCVREIPVLDKDKNFPVRLNICSGELNSTAKIVETFSRDYDVIPVKKLGAGVSVNPGQIIFVWNKIPKNKELSVEYKLIPKNKSDIKQPKINGQMFYIKSGKVVKILVKEKKKPKNNLGAAVNIENKKNSNIKTIKTKEYKQSKTAKDTRKYLGGN